MSKSSHQAAFSMALKCSTTQSGGMWRLIVPASSMWDSHHAHLM